jgi:hypothetical protein
VCRELGQEAELDRRQPQLVAGQRGALGTQVHDEVAQLDRGDDVVRGPTDQGAGPGRQLGRLERLRDVVVGAELECGDDVARAVAGGEDQDRDGGGVTDAAADLEAVGCRDHEVEDDEVEVRPLDGGQRRGAVGGRRHGEARPFEHHGDDLPHGGVVLDRQDGAGRPRPVDRRVGDVEGSASGHGATVRGRPGRRGVGRPL